MNDKLTVGEVAKTLAGISFPHHKNKALYKYTLVRTGTKAPRQPSNLSQSQGQALQNSTSFIRPPTRAVPSPRLAEEAPKQSDDPMIRIEGGRVVGEGLDQARPRGKINNVINIPKSDKPGSVMVIDWDDDDDDSTDDDDDCDNGDDNMIEDEALLRLLEESKEQTSMLQQQQQQQQQKPPRMAAPLQQQSPTQPPRPGQLPQISPRAQIPPGRPEERLPPSERAIPARPTVHKASTMLELQQKTAQEVPARPQLTVPRSQSAQQLVPQSPPRRPDPLQSPRRPEAPMQGLSPLQTPFRPASATPPPRRPGTVPLYVRFFCPRSKPILGRVLKHYQSQRLFLVM